MSKLKILIVEDEVLIAEDIAAHLRKTDFDIAGIAHDSERALDLIATRQPDAVLLDINIKGTKDGIDIGGILHEQYKIPFVYLTSYADRHTVERAKVTMPYGYILKPFDERDLMTSIEMAVFRHAQLHQPEIPSLEKINEQLLSPLTGKEYEIALALYEGIPNKEIAAKHFISINTVKSHVKNVYLKLDIHHRTALIKKFQQW